MEITDGCSKPIKHYKHADVLKPLKPGDKSLNFIFGTTLLPAVLAAAIGWLIPGNIFGDDANLTGDVNAKNIFLIGQYYGDGYPLSNINGANIIGSISKNLSINSSFILEIFFFKRKSEKQFISPLSQIIAPEEYIEKGRLLKPVAPPAPPELRYPKFVEREKFAVLNTANGAT